MMAIGRKIREYRRQRKIRQVQLARLSGISNTYLSDIENCRSIPSLKVIIRIAAALKIELTDLLK